ncbi:MAG: hypothetical protein EHM42_13900, partial [Planctomycetaceae bacterium]
MLQCPRCGAAIAQIDVETPNAAALQRLGPDDITWHPEMRSLVLQDRMPEALRLYRDRTGARGDEAAAAITSLRRGDMMAIPTSLVGEGTSAEADLLNLLRRGRGSEAALLFGKYTGQNRRAAQEAVRRLAARYDIAAPTAGCLSGLSLLLAVTAILVAA